MERSASVVSRLLDWQQATRDDDPEALAQLTTDRHGLVLFSTLPRHKLRGPLVVEPGAPVGYEEGTIGWVADEATLHASGLCARPAQVTAVFRREAGLWKLVQHHVSV
jgi:ketosteroid isomerase-like protein